jgi:hypothetical protein
MIVYEPRFKHVDLSLSKLKTMQSRRTVQTAAFTNTFAKTSACHSLAAPPPPPPSSYQPSIFVNANVQNALYKSSTIQWAQSTQYQPNIGEQSNEPLRLKSQMREMMRGARMSPSLQRTQSIEPAQSRHSSIRSDNASKEPLIQHGTASRQPSQLYRSQYRPSPMASKQAKAKLNLYKYDLAIHSVDDFNLFES